MRLASAATDLLIVALDGPLGAGKTQWARGFVRGIDPAFAEWVSSPTYAICNTYPCAPPVHHLDLYRLEDADDLEGIGYYELDDGHRIVEWSARIPSVHASADIEVTIARGDGDERTLTVVARTPLGAAAVQALSTDRAT